MALLQAAYRAMLKPSCMFEQLTDLASATCHSRVRMPSHAARLFRKERTAGSLSIDKIGDE